MGLLAPVAPRFDVPSPGEHQPVDALDQLDPILLPLVVGRSTGSAPAASSGRPYPNP